MITEISKIVALDEKGREFPKTVTLIQADGKNLIEFGLWERYNLSSLQGHVEKAESNAKFYLDLMGRNHMGSGVYIKIHELKALLLAANGVIDAYSVEQS